MNVVEDLLVRILIAELLPGGFGSCRSCTEPVVIGVEELLDHYGRRHQEVIVVGLAVAVASLGLTALALRSARA